MKVVRFIPFFLSLICMLACNPKPKSPGSKDIAFARHPSSNSFKPAAFKNDQRKEKILSITSELHELVEEHRKERNIPGIAYGIVVDNELVLADATGLMNLENELAATTKSSFRIASMTKSFTALAIVKLRDEGMLSLEDPVEKYIPEMVGLEYLTSDAPVIDIENLLTMTAGFPEDNPWGDRQLNEPNEMLMDLMAGGVSFSNPASFTYEYSNTGYALLGSVISRVSGQPYQEYIHENILLPLGMEQTYWEYSDIPQEQLAIGYRWEDEQWKLEPMLHDGSYGSMGGLITSIEDFSKYVSFHLSAWPPRTGADNGPVMRSTLREMHTPQFSNLYSEAKDWYGEPCPAMGGYGYGLRIVKNCKGDVSVSHGGALPGFGSNYAFYPEYGVGIMAFCNLTYTSPWPLREVEKLLFDKLDLEPRKLPVSDILTERQEQVVELIKHWDPELEEKILAENFYLDRSREDRMAEFQKVFDQAGELQSDGELQPFNQLRGLFTLQGENGEVRVFFTLSPEKDPKIQQLNVSFREK